MGVYDNTLITTTNISDRIDDLVAFLNTVSGVVAEKETVSISSADYLGAKFTIEGGKLEGFFGYNSSNIRFSGVYLKDVLNDAYLINPTSGGNNYASGGANTKVNVYTNVVDGEQNATVIHIADTASAYTVKIEVASLHIDNNILAGFVLASHEYTDISSLTFKNITTNNGVLYSYTNMFPYAASIGKLDYLGQAYFVNGNNLKKFTTDILRECSTVTLLSTASLVDGNWIALGAHCLAPLDSEEDE